MKKLTAALAGSSVLLLLTSSVLLQTPMRTTRPVLGDQGSTDRRMLPPAMAGTNDTSEGMVDSSIGVLFINKTAGITCDIYPSQVSDDLGLASPLRYLPHAEIVTRGDLPYYDAARKILSFDILLPTPHAASFDEAIASLMPRYNTSDRQALSFAPAHIVAYDVSLSSPSLKEDLRIHHEKPRSTAFGREGRITIDFPVADPGLKEDLTADIRRVTVRFEPQYRFRSYQIARVIASTSDRLSQDVWEDAFGDVKNAEFIVSRNVLTHLQKQITSRREIELRGATEEQKKQALVQLEQALKKHPLTDDELNKAVTTPVVMTVGNLRLEIAPNEWKDRKNQFESATALMSTLEQTWDNLAECLDKGGDEVKTYQNVQEFLKKSGNASGSGNYASIFSGSGSLSLNFEKDYEKTNGDERKTFREHVGKLKMAGGSKKMLTESAYEKWTGDKYGEGKTLASLKFYRISRGDFASATRDSFSEIIPGQATIGSRTMQLKFDPTVGFGNLSVGSDLAVAGVIGGAVPVGTVCPFAALPSAKTEENLAKHGWAYCRGQRVKRGRLPELEKACGVLHGADETTFSLPDYGSFFLRGFDWRAAAEESHQRSASAPGGASGNSIGTLQQDAVRRQPVQMGVQSTQASEYVHVPSVQSTAEIDIQTFMKGNIAGKLDGHNVAFKKVSLSAQIGNGTETRPINKSVDFIIKVSDIGVSIQKLQEAGVLVIQPAQPVK